MRGRASPPLSHPVGNVERHGATRRRPQGSARRQPCVTRRRAGSSAPRTPRRSSSGWRSAPGTYLQLDDVVVVERMLPDGQPVRIYGVVSQVRARHEGARFDSDVFLVADGVLPAEVSEAAQVLATRFEPEVFVPPLPGERGAQGQGRRARRGAVLRPDAQAGCPPGLSRDDEPVYLNLEFLDGTRGAHVNISGVSGVATKTTYATFLLYSLFTLGRARRRGRQHQGAHLQRQGRGPALPRPRQHRARATTSRPATPALGLPAGPFGVVAFFAPPRARRPQRQPRRRRPPARRHVVLLDDRGVLPRGAAAVPVRRRRGRPPAVHDGRAQRHRPAQAQRRAGRRRRGQHRRARSCAPSTSWSSSSRHKVDHDGARPVGRPGHRRRHGQRLRPPAARRAAPPRPPDPGRRRPARARTGSTSTAQVTVVDIHNLNDRAKRFVVGVVLRRAFERKERSGQARPLQFVVLDELNKYAPREGSSPIKEILLDVAERGRSLGIILIGAQQTASEVERRIVANSAIRVVGRLDTAEAARGEYGFLPPVQRQRATIIKPGTMIVAQPELPDAAGACSSRSRPGPPGPARPARPGAAAGDGPTAGRHDRSAAHSRLVGSARPTRSPGSPRGYGAPMRVLHTSDWHVGKAIRGRSPGRRAPGGAGRDRGGRRARGGRPRASSPATCSTPPRPPPSPSGSSTGRCSTWPPAAARWSSSPATTTPPAPGGGGAAVRGERHPRGLGHPPARRRRRARGRRPAASGARVALLPFLSQRYVVTADLLLSRRRRRRPRRLRRPGRAHPRGCSPRGFRADTVNLVAAHLMVIGGTLGGGERGAHTVFDYWVPATGVPGRGPVRGARPPAPGPAARRARARCTTAARRCSSTSARPANEPAVNVVDVRPGLPAEVRAVALTAGRRLRTLRGTLVDVLAAAAGDDAGDDRPATPAGRARRAARAGWPTRCASGSPTRSRSCWRHRDDDGASAGRRPRPPAALAPRPVRRVPRRPRRRRRAPGGAVRRAGRRGRVRAGARPRR